MSTEQVIDDWLRTQVSAHHLAVGPSFPGTQELARDLANRLAPQPDPQPLPELPPVLAGLLASNRFDALDRQLDKLHEKLDTLLEHPDQAEDALRIRQLHSALLALLTD